MSVKAIVARFALAAIAPIALAQNEPSVTDPLDTDALTRPESIYVEKIEVRGSSVFTAEELMAMTAAYENRNVSVEEVHELRHALSRAYVERGYVSSGVVIPDQRVEDGTVVLEAIEGDLTEIEIQGNHRFREAALAKRIERRVQEPLDIDDLQASLETIREDPLVERVDAQLLPGAELGESYLRLGITERPPFEIEVAASNDRSTSVGEDRGTIGFTYRGLIGNGDVLTARFGFTDGVEDDFLSYRVPLTAGGVVLEILGSDQQADIVEEPFTSVDIESRLKVLSFTASYPFTREGGDTFTGILGFEHKHSESTLLDSPFSFSPGDVDGRAQGSTVVAGVDWSRRDAARAWAARGVFQIGVDALDATINSVGPDSEFVAFVGQFQVLQTLDRSSRLIGRGLVQATRDPLLAMYKLPVGGRYTVRGYRENQFVRDNAIVASIEYQMPVVVDAAGRPRGNVYLAVFADYGATWDENDALASSAKEEIGSAGLGVLWDPLPGLHMELYWGAASKDVGNPSTSLQDQGIHYRLSFNRAFGSP
jgi:hemolysin activation/secretion protein